MSENPKDILVCLALTLGISPSQRVVFRADMQSNSALLFTTSDVLRMEWCSPIDPVREELIWQAVDLVGIPVPKLVDRGVFQGRRWMRYRRLSGGSIHSSKALFEAGLLLYKLHAAPTSEFPREFAGRARRRLRYVDALTECANNHALANWRRLVQAAAEDWVSNREVPTHGDYRADNLLTDGDRVCAVIDWSDARVSTRERDLGSVDATSFPSIYSGYLAAATKNVEIRKEIVLGHSMARHAALQAHGVIDREHAIRSVAVFRRHLSL